MGGPFVEMKGTADQKCLFFFVCASRPETHTLLPPTLGTGAACSHVQYVPDMECRLAHVPLVVLTCALLHNICMDHAVPLDPDMVDEHFAPLDRDQLETRPFQKISASGGAARRGAKKVPWFSSYRMILQHL